MAAFDKLLKVAKNTGVTICVENSGNFHYPFIAELIEKLALIEGVFFTWDVGHDAKTGFKETEILLKHKNKIRHMHLHYYKGGVDHQPLFSGEIDIKGMLLFAKNYDLKVVIEVKTVDSLKKSIKLLVNDANAAAPQTQHCRFGPEKANS